MFCYLPKVLFTYSIFIEKKNKHNYPTSLVTAAASSSSCSAICLVKDALLVYDSMQILHV